MSKSRDTALFLQPEIRCETYISTDMKKVWFAELQMVELVIEICKKHDLSYQMIGGSLLGAVRHEGFIPWDDDIDIGMVRSHYEKFISFATKELKEPFFLQTSLSDPGRNIEYAQIRNSATSAIDLRYVDERLTYNQGIFIDIFPIDAVGNEKTLKAQQKKKTLYRKIYQNTFSNGGDIQKRAKHVICKMLYYFIGPEKLYKKRNEIFSSVNIDTCEELGLVSWIFGTRRNYWKRADILDCINVPFENLMVSIPQNYDRVLTQTYGDWHKYIKDAAMHDDIDFSTTYPYGEYLVKKYGYPEGMIAICNANTIPDASIELDKGARIVPLTIDDDLDVYSFLQSIKQSENYFDNDVKGMTFAEYKEWLVQQSNWANGKNLPDGSVPQTIYWLYVDDKPIGYGIIQWGSVKDLHLLGKNLAFAISENHRGKGYGRILFNALVDIMKNGGYSKLIITVMKPNYALRAVIEKSGGKIIKENEERWFFTL